MPREDRLYGEIFLLSFAVILLEVAYTRVFSFKLFYFFTYLIIGIALLGLGTGGVLVAASTGLRRVTAGRLIALFGLLGGASVLAGYPLVAVSRMNAIELVRTLTVLDFAAAFPRAVKLALLSGCLFVPFLAAGTALARVFAARAEDMHRLYFADLLGAGLACALSVPLISTLSPPGCVMLAGLLFVLATVRAAAGSPALRLASGVLALALLVGVALPGRLPDPVPDRVKTLGNPSLGVTPVFSRWSPVFRVDVLPNPFDGGSQMIAHDGMWGAALFHYDGDPASLTRLEVDPRALPFRVLRPAPRVLIIGAAGGNEILASLYFRAGHVTAVELNPVTVSLLTTHFADYTGHLADHPRVSLTVGEGRSFLAREGDRHDLIWFVAPDSYAAMNAATASSFVLSESYLYTREMIRESLDHLTEGGVICAQFGELQFARRPVRTVRYLATARAAFRDAGMPDFGAHVLVATTPAFVGQVYSTILLRREPFTPAEIEHFAAATRAIPQGEVRHPPPSGAEDQPVARVISLPDRDLAAWYDAYPFRVTPVSDDSPFFWNFVRFRDAILRSYRATFDPEEATGERLLLVLLVLVVLFAAASLVVPLVGLRTAWRATPGKSAVAVYFAAIGLGFMFVEVSLIQRLTLFLGYPTHALTVTLFALLLSTGIGSLASARWGDSTRMLPVLATLLAGLLALHAWALAPLVRAAIGAPFALRVALAAAAIAPLGLCLGAFLPLGLRAVARVPARGEALAAWAWAVNGFASVVSSVLATIVAMAFGFQTVLLAAAVAYAVALLTLPRLPGLGARHSA